MSVDRGNFSEPRLPHALAGTDEGGISEAIIGLIVLPVILVVVVGLPHLGKTIVQTRINIQEDRMKSTRQATPAYTLRNSRPVRLLSVFTLAIAVMLLAAVAMPSGAEAAKALTIDNIPSGKSITVGEAGRVGKVKASGIAAKRIRFSIEGHDGFSIKKKLGIINYDGSAVSGDSVTLTVTVSDNKKNNSISSVSAHVTVTVNQPQQQQQQPRQPKNTKCAAGLVLYAGDRCSVFDFSTRQVSVEILSDGNARIDYTCWTLFRCQRTLSNSFNINGLEVVKSQGTWTVRMVC